MIISCCMKDAFELQEVTEDTKDRLRQAIWIDLINPTKEEEALVETCSHLELPSMEKMREIELSSRLYEDNGILFMTASMISKSETTTPSQDSVSFVLTPKQLITIRYIEPQAFTLFIMRLKKLRTDSVATFFTEFLDATIDRIADILEIISHRLENSSAEIFNPKETHDTNYKRLLQQLGLDGSLNSKIVESLISFDRLIHFFNQSANTILQPYDRERLVSLNKDLHALTDHASFLSNKINFLLEAILGLVQIEQNTIIKIFSVAAVIFLPPTLIASIYGMNFKFMPNLIDWEYGFMLSIALMLFSAWAPYKYFKYRKWL